MTAECLLIVIILNLNFVPDFEAELVHCAFAMFLFGSLVSLAILLFWRLYIKQADESAFSTIAE